MKKNKKYSVVVIGGGHAGVEAACAPARMGSSVALVTHKIDKIGEMSCNPAIGGLGKGHLVREIDALDGVMGRAIDRGGIQFRMLNESRGAAVRGPRAQADRVLYKKAILEAVKNQQNLDIIEGSVKDIIVKNRQVAGIELSSGQKISCESVVLTTGTFLRGIIRVGDKFKFFSIISWVFLFVWVIKHDICGVWIDLLIKEKGIGWASGSCSSKLLKFIDFLSILGGVPVLSLPIENFNFSIFFANAIEGLSPTLPAGEDSLPSLIIPLRKVPVVRTADKHVILSPLLSSINLIFLSLIPMSSTEPSIKSRFL